jgi:anti-anti-sigma regulatory factor
MEHARRRRERNPNAETPERRNGPEAAPVVRSSAGVRKPELRLLVVGGRRIDVAAIGDFDAASHDDVSSRLDRLVAGGSGCLHVDCSRIVSIDRSVVDLFADVRERLQSRGGTLELVDAPPELLCAMGDTVSESATPTADALRASSSAVAS